MEDFVGIETEPRGAPTAAAALWFLAAVLAGIDTTQAGWLSVVAAVGAALSAVCGGRLSDRVGRKPVLAGVVAFSGIATLASTLVSSDAGLLVTQLLGGVGVGALLPNLLTLTYETTPARNRQSVTALMYCGVPLGSALGTLLGTQPFAQAHWRLMLAGAGIAPLVLSLLLLRYVDESPAFPRAVGVVSLAIQRARMRWRESVGHALFRGGRAVATGALWFAGFGSGALMYLLYQGLPLHLAPVWLDLAAVCGLMLGGAWLDRWRWRPIVRVLYAGSALALGLLAVLFGVGADVRWLLVGALVAQSCAAASCMVQFALAALFYGPRSRGTGSGAIIGCGVLGALMVRALLAATPVHRTALPEFATGALVALSGLALTQLLRRAPAVPSY